MCCKPNLLSSKWIYSFVVIGFVIVDSCRGNSDSRYECTLPKHPINGRWWISGSKPSEPGQQISSGGILNIACNGQYKLNGPSLIRCNGGTWSAEIGECLETCPPIISTSSTKVICTTNGKTTDDCKNAINGTIATFKCSSFYENSELNRSRICRNGSWGQNEIPTCTPICGLKPKPSKMRKAYFPWNVAIYEKQNEEKTFKCAGTLINERLILTAAHCVSDSDGKISPANMYSVAAGKSSDQYHDVQDSEAQYSELEDMFIPQEFRGTIRKYRGDIAILIIRNSFIMSRRIQPACLDWSNKYSEEFEYPKITGSISGPLKSRSWPHLKEVIEIPVPFANDTQCYAQLLPDDIEKVNNFEAMYLYDKLLSGYINSDKVPMYRLNHGAGLVSKNPYDGKYYVTGIMSAFPSIHSKNCDNKRWVLFTKVSTYISTFITEKNDLYTPIRRQYFQTSCGVKSFKTLVVNGQNVTKGDYPWQVAIYKIQGTIKTLICGGSLINQRVILTAAHCVTDLKGKTLKKELFVVAVGKYFRKFDEPRDNEAQFSTLKSIVVPTQYQGEIQNYLADIAILITENSFTLTRNVEPVCVDWDRKYEKQFLSTSATGFVAGWGFTKENDSPSEELKELEVPYVDKETCKEDIPSDYQIYLTSDKMCSGFLNTSGPVCRGDSGGGLVFKNMNDDRYYITGIVSLSPQEPTDGCDNQRFALYTKVSEYIQNFILDIVRLYWA